jgi:hypothetical protein
VVNCSPGSELQVFERMEFADAVAAASAECGKLVEHAGLVRAECQTSRRPHDERRPHRATTSISRSGRRAALRRAAARATTRRRRSRRIRRIALTRRPPARRACRRVTRRRAM